MKRTFHRALPVFLALALSFICSGLGTPAFAASAIYVNDGSNVLGTDIGSAYAVGGSDSASVVGDSYALTGNGTVRVGEAPGGDGSTVTAPIQIARIGLDYYYSSSRDSSVSFANLKNSVGSGFDFGYYDSSRVFHKISTTDASSVTVAITGSGREVTVTNDIGGILYVNSQADYNLAIHPICYDGKAVTAYNGHTYYGDFEFYRYISNRLTVINVLDLEDYIKGVITIEMSPSWPIEALKAQAVCARTYYAKSIGNYAAYGFDVTDDPYCQAYIGTGRSNANSDAAVEATRDLYVTYNGSLCTTFYFSSDGGGTENSENVFVARLAYCRGKADPYEDAVPQSVNGKKSWSYNFTNEALGSKLGIGSVAKSDVTYSSTGNVIKIVFTDVSGNTKTIAKSSCYSSLGLPSLHYTVTADDTSFTFSGSGFGHNVGMSQFGAYSMAKNYGKTYQDIIKFYYTGVSISTGV